ncbi:hypothetical protein D8Y20_07200 [Mariprofundus sp. EBB-1]|uniref:hypothetical protein n=1 Tax=Mariprofundus sp. EBB-1 TaxID=2650971 RepID=UPI000EF1EFB3|nr:hypothetical protein [Mariprofundus sp. EBB-1]RLL52293.1 hypothetical protein D8Y20_07200 [Mariprofundus sp. EBB-1]
MNIMTTLETFKGKELDNALLEFIFRVFNSQNDQINQLNTDKRVLQESISNQNDTLAELKRENEALFKNIQQLEEQKTFLQTAAANSRMTEVETAILSNCVNADIAGFCSEDMVISLPFSRLDITNAIDQLERKGLIEIGPLASNGTFYLISESGKKHELEIERNVYAY